HVSFLSTLSVSAVISTLSLHDALPIWCYRSPRPSAGGVDLRLLQLAAVVDVDGLPFGENVQGRLSCLAVAVTGVLRAAERQMHLDRKSTRLNSSHVEISYAVFCLKKKI